MPTSSKICVCPSCNKNVTKTEYSIACSDCKICFHLSCTNISISEVKKKSAVNYACNACKAKRISVEDVGRRFENIADDMKKQMEEQTQCLSDFQAIVDKVVETVRVEFMGSLRKLKEDVDGLKQQILDERRVNSLLREEVQSCKQKTKDVER